MKTTIENLKQWIADIEYDIQQNWLTEQERIIFERQRRDLLFMLALAENIGANNNIPNS